MGHLKLLLSPSLAFTLFLMSALFGIALAGIVWDSILVLLLVGLSILLSSLAAFFLGKFLVVWNLFCIAGLLLGSLYTLFHIQHIEQRKEILAPYLAQYNSYSGEIRSVHKKYDYQDEYIVLLEQLNGQDISEAGIRHLLRVPKNFSLAPGQHISYSGKMYEFRDFNGFAYQKYMLAQKLYFSTSSSSIETLEHEKDWSYTLFHTREKLLARIHRMFPRNEAIFLGGILLGARENIPRELEEDFNNSGLTHFIAVSGFNITLCVIFVSFLFGFLPLWGRIIMVSLSICLFALFVGLVAPVVRASIMGVLAYIFLQSGAQHRNITLLAFTALLMALFSPLDLSYDVSLHLSFLAVMGIVYTQDFFKRMFAFVPEFFAIREALVLTLAALSFALPIMIFQFGQLSLLSPLANIAVTWTIPIAMLLGALSIGLDMISPILGQVGGFITWIFLHYDMQMVHIFGNAHWALIEFEFGAYKQYLQALYFIVLAYIVTLFHIKKEKSY